MARLRKNMDRVKDVLSTQDMLGSVIRDPEGKTIYDGIKEARKRKKRREEEKNA